VTSAVTWRRDYGIPALLGAYAAAIALAPSPSGRLFLIAPLVAVPFALWTLASPARWMVVFLCSALVLPPLPIELGDSGPHVSLVIVALGVFSGFVRMREWRLRLQPEHLAILAYWFVLAASVSAAAIYSGPVIAAASAARVLLFGISIYMFFYAAFGPGSSELTRSTGGIRALYWAGIASALFACVDFYFQFPAPAGFGPQFVWLDSGVFRRAQGVFYEASTLGNVCAFFLVMTAVAAAGHKVVKPLSKRALTIGVAVFGSAMMLSFSRASLVNVIVAVVTLLILHKRQIGVRRLVLLPFAILAGGGLVSYFLFPRLTSFYLERATASVLYFFSATEGILSGRLESWRILGGFLAEQPWHAIAGIGYKTLPYSDFIGQRVIADNAYLGALVETGVIGLVAMLAFNFAVLRISYRAARQSDSYSAFLGTCVFCFWVGEMVQMISGDLLTYWRVLPVYLFVLGLAARHTADESAVR
jgi:O-antigen ligase